MTMLTSTGQTNMEVLIVGPFLTQGLITYCTVACASVVKCARAYAKVCVLYRVTRHVASTSGQSMTNGANYKIGKLYDSPWHSDICTSNQLNNSQ